ncbi:MAG: hypothetical protein Q7K03_12080 [Dehalococcoidia bacterium]|nr:hypothetical protein [Dehalococcoidia bacterium]
MPFCSRKEGSDPVCGMEVAPGKAAAMATSSVSVVTNASRLRGFKVRYK